MATDLVQETSCRVRGLRSSLAHSSARIAVLLLLFLIAPVYESLQSTSIYDRDIWWRLRIGLWILQNHTVPSQGLFSQAAGTSWVDSTWGFEVLTAAAYSVMGLRAITAILVLFRAALAVATFFLAYRSRGSFWVAVTLSVVAQFVIANLQPGPALFSILFFGVELALLLEVRQSRHVRSLYWLPVLFLVWANLHNQFVLGLLLLGLFVLAECAERMLHGGGDSSRAAPPLPPGNLVAVVALSVLATLLTPYSFRIFLDAVKYTYHPLLFEHFIEMTPLGFRRPQDFLLALLVLAAFFTLGRQRSRDLFKLALMTITLVVAFRIQRDSWLAVLSAIAVIGDAMHKTQPGTSLSLQGKWQKAVIAVGTALVLTTAVMGLPGDDAILDKVSGVFPRKACDFLRANRLPGPLFNTYSWGGFLIWYLPEYPAAVDGRLNLYGTANTDKHFKVTSGAERLESDPRFSRAQTILLERNSSLSNAIMNLPVLRAQFRVAYEDENAVVLLRR